MVVCAAEIPEILLNKVTVCTFPKHFESTVHRGIREIPSNPEVK